MFRCNNCKKVFEDFDVVYDTVGEYQGQPYQEPVDICPYCNSDDIVEVIKLDDSEIMYNFLCDSFLYEDLVDIMFSMLGRNEDVCKEIYSRLMSNKVIEDDKDYQEYKEVYSYIEL